MLLLRVVKVAQFFEFYKFKKILRSKFENFADFVLQNQLRVKQLAIIDYTDCYKPFFVFHSTDIFRFR